jgi:predicted acyltransferase
MDRTPTDRLLSLDFLRGLIMVLLVLESTSLFEHLFEVSQGTFAESLFIQFFHHPWNGLRFWDLIQPGFMFMAGTAMAFSLHKQTLAGIAWSKQLLKILRRCGLLFFWGVLDYAVRPKGLSFELWDVLTQLSLTTIVTFLIFRFSTTTQIGVSGLLLLLTEIIYRYSNIPGFNQPFVDQHNIGNYIDLLLMNKVNDGGWVAINCLPTAAHTIWGALAGKLLLSTNDNAHKINALLVAGFMCLSVGYFMDWTITPIIKRIATSSFTLASGGWCLIALAICYWWIDLRGHKQKLFFFTVVGMNSIFIYLFFEIVASRWFNGHVGAITNGLMMLASVPSQLMLVITSLCIFSCEWFLCYWLYKKNIFFKL